MNDSIHDRLMDFLMGYAPMREWHFNVSRARERSYAVIPVSGEEYAERWIGGGGLCHYDFTVKLFCAAARAPFKPGARNKEAESIDEAEGLMRWLAEQSRSGRLPELGEGRRAQSLTLLSNTPANEGDDAVSGLNKLSFQARLTYLKEGDL